MSKKNSKSLPHEVEVAKKVLEAQGINFKEWSSRVIAERLIEFTQGMDEKWREKTLQEECYRLVISELDKRLS